MRRRFMTLDVFTQSRFGGNPLALVLDAEGLDTAAMQTIAREFSHPETVFVSAPANPAHKASMRIFTPANELPFAGHPTIGTAVGLARGDGGEATRQFVLEQKIGPVSCTARPRDADSGYAAFKLPRLPERVGDLSDAATMAGALCLDASDIATEPYAASRWSAGVPYSIVPIRTLAAIGRARPDPTTFERVFGFGGPAMVALICTATVDTAHQLHMRMFAPANGIPEDPATGSAAAAFAGLCAAQGGLTDGVHKLIIEQGYEMGRPSQIGLSLDITGGKLVGASITGDAVVVTEGVIEA